MSGPRLETAEQQWDALSFAAEVSKRQQQLQQQGLCAGQVFMFPAPASPATVWTFHAVWAIGAIAMPTPDTMTTAQQASFERAKATPAAPDTALRLLTSGTTGTPKVVDLSTTQLNASAEASRERLGCDATDRWLCCLPLHHIAGISILKRTAVSQATTVLHTGFDPAAVSRAIDEEQVSMFSAVPTMLQRILDLREEARFPDHLRVILLGGAPTPAALLDRCRSMQVPVALTWGMTETASQIATRIPGDLRADGDVGLPLPGTTVSIVDGYLAVEGPIAPGGRWVTSDRGEVDESGRVIIHGRGDALIISGGENVDPRRVELALCAHPSVTEAAVVGVPDELWGERPVAFVVGQETAGLHDWLKTQLAAHECPVMIRWLDSLPLTALGKHDRGALRACLRD